MSKMSHDCVHFTVFERFLQKKPIRECLVETLGFDEEYLRQMALKNEDLHVICRPSQFARFVILRHIKYEEPNNMACLNMKLVVPDPTPKQIDVSRNPNCVE